LVTFEPRRLPVNVASLLAVCAGLLAAPALAGVAQAGAPRTTEIYASVKRGVQIYECQQPAAGPTSYVFKQPRATLERRIQHDAGPVWLAPDGSGVKGTVVASTPRPGTIPALTLSATSIGGPGLLSAVTTIRREDTEGGVAPAGPCRLGKVVKVPYEATYVFVRPAPPRHRPDCPPTDEDDD
jgi:hypothetical protein